MAIPSIKISVLSLSFLLFGCDSPPDSVPLSQQNHCDGKPAIERQSLSSYLAPYKDQLSAKTGVYVLEQGAEAMMSRAWLTESAEKSIDIQYFIFSVDNIGLIASDMLVQAAERGVKVRVLVDDLMIEARGDELLMLAGHENIEIKIYNPNVNIGKNLAQKIKVLVTDFHGLNQRMHNKIFVVDNQVAITGGRNIADEYFGFDHDYNFRDRDVFLAGKEVEVLTTSFEEYWQHDLSISVEKLFPEDTFQEDPDFSRLHAYACNPENFHPEIRAEIEKVPETFRHLEEQGKFRFIEDVEYIYDKPGKNDKSEFLGGGSITQDKLVELADSAKESILIQTPYLVTTARDRVFLKELVDRGISIKILTNSLASNDNLEAFSGYQRDRKALLDTGVEIYEFKPDAKVRQRVMTEHMVKRLPTQPIFGLHAKTMTIDNHTTVIGTYNLDPRSANLNTESITFVRSESITKDVRRAMEVELEPENAWRITEDFNPDDTVSTSKQLKVKLRRIVPKNIL
ncbi:Major cardiolipin synthase ClsA [Grimontia celer]|uniref:Major cardiolipin synthase ClsA n=1 Tax=Grimontia celer TaxID=1796497 RepID=A0A128EWS2_9GAMM|nr:phospholipase D family protein [Grimontia celer]CZF79028.1 Major cardiolipin synthase ClsA [Grimontia celer]